MHIFSSSKTARHYRSLAIATLLQLTGTINCLHNLRFAANTRRVVGIYERLPAVCDDDYKKKYFPRKQHRASQNNDVPQTIFGVEKQNRDLREIGQFDYNAMFSAVERSSPEFLPRDTDGSTEFIESQDNSLGSGRDFVPLWNFTDSEDYDFGHDREHDREFRRRFLRNSRGDEIDKPKRNSIRRAQKNLGDSPGSFVKKSSRFHRKSHRRSNLTEKTSAQPNMTRENYESSLVSRQNYEEPDDFFNPIGVHHRRSWSENDCKSGRRIVGGSAVRSIEQIPYIVFVDSGCGGAIVSNIWVLTAGHCVDEAEPQYVHTGSIKFMRGCMYHVVYVYIHPGFTRKNLESDIAMLKISPRFIFSPAIKPIRMSNTKVRRKTCGIVAGWGAETFKGPSKYKLMMITLPVVGYKKCQRFNVKEGQFCAGYADARGDACQGDSGGPFVVDGILVGIVSFGYKCATPDTPGVYVDVSYHRQWIRSIAGI